MSVMTEKITQAEFARLVGVTPQRITNAIKAGRIKVESDGLILKIQNLARWRKYLDPSKIRENKPIAPRTKSQHEKPKSNNANIPTEPDKLKPKTERERKKKIREMLQDSEIEDYNDAKFRKEKYNAMYRKLEYEEKLGTLVSKDEVKQKYFTIVRNFRDEIMTIPTRLSASFSSHIVEFIRAKMQGDFTEQQIETLLKKISVNEIEHIAFTDWKRESENSLHELEKLRK